MAVACHDLVETGSRSRSSDCSTRASSRGRWRVGATARDGAARTACTSSARRSGRLRSRSARARRDRARCRTSATDRQRADLRPGPRAAGNATAAVENVALWHERDISHSARAGDPARLERSDRLHAAPGAARRARHDRARRAHARQPRAHARRAVLAARAAGAGGGRYGARRGVPHRPVLPGAHGTRERRCATCSPRAGRRRARPRRACSTSAGTRATPTRSSRGSTRSPSCGFSGVAGR